MLQIQDIPLVEIIVMKNILRATFLVSFIVVSFAFTENHSHEFTRVYGVSADDSSQIQLVLNDDHSFTYQDFSNPDHKITVDGKWESRNNTIILSTSNTYLRFHSKWRISADGQVAKSRMGMTFYSLFRK